MPRTPAVSAAASRAGVCCVSIIDHEGKRLVATGSSDGQIMVVDGAPRPASRMRNKRRPKTAATARTRFFKGIHRKTITGIAFHRGSDLVVVSCSNDSTCEVYDVFDGEEVANMTYHAGCVNCLEVSRISSEELVGEAGGSQTSAELYLLLQLTAPYPPPCTRNG